ncbi:hypothetical protein F4779DRAFT_266678 [Xylariaceae sp. FL0662B]|nr:hypothetical protein F4779DRAFT_266678 [Xylariaceae sp. FL0662B]
MDPATLRSVLAVLHNLRGLKVSECKIVDDDIFKYNDVLPAFPALEEMVLKDTPKVTSDGLVAYLSREDTQKSLEVLSLTNTGVQPSTLYNVLAHAPNLTTLSTIEQVSSAFPSHAGPVPPLTNWSLQTLHFEITAAAAAGSPYASITTGYYNYLASSLFAGGLPLLSAVYVREQNFPDMLLGLPPPAPGFAGGPQRPSSSGSTAMFNPRSGGLSPSNTGDYGNRPPRFSSNNPFASAINAPHVPAALSLNQTLEVFTKGEDDLDWGSIRMDPFDAYGDLGTSGRGRRERSASVSSARPLSSYGLADVSAGWQAGHGARKSIVVQGNGTGGFLAVPGNGGVGGYGRRGSAASAGGANEDLWPRPSSSQGPRKGDRDLWR